VGQKGSEGSAASSHLTFCDEKIVIHSRSISVELLFFTYSFYKDVKMKKCPLSSPFLVCAPWHGTDDRSASVEAGSQAQDIEPAY